MFTTHTPAIPKEKNKKVRVKKSGLKKPDTRIEDSPTQNRLNVTREKITRLHKLNGPWAEARQGNRTVETGGVHSR